MDNPLQEYWGAVTCTLASLFFHQGTHLFDHSWRQDRDQTSQYSCSAMLTMALMEMLAQKTFQS